MLKRSFVSLAKPRLKYPAVASHVGGTAKEIPLPSRGSFFFRQFTTLKDTLGLRAGDRIKTGQKLVSDFDDDRFLVAPFSGNLNSISEYTGYLGKRYTCFLVEIENEDTWDETFPGLIDAGDFQGAFRYLSALPGGEIFLPLLKAGDAVDTFVISALDDDLFMADNMHALAKRAEWIQKGIEPIKKSTSASRIILVAPPELGGEASRIGAEIISLKPVYPETLEPMLLRKVLGKSAVESKRPSRAAALFLTAEAVAAVGEAFSQKRLPLQKTLTVLDKTSTPQMVRARIGTAVRDVLEALQVHTQHGDRLISGGLMKGQALFSEDTPISFDTQGLIVQDKSQVVSSSDNPCVNCGECVRACPVRIPVNMLVRFLENRLYGEAERDWDLFSCIECGLCSFVCIAHIPLFHYIMLGKHEVAQMRGEEEANA